MARVYSPPRKISSSSICRLACIRYAGQAAAMNTEVAVAKKISAERENPASRRCVRMLFDQRQRLVPVVFQILDFDRFLAYSFNPIPPHQYFADSHVVVTSVVRKERNK